MRATRMRRTAAVFTSCVVAGLGLVTSPVQAAAPAPCDMKVTLNKQASNTYSNGVQRVIYTAKVTTGSHSQTATVQQMIMPTGVVPRLVTQPLGGLAQLRTMLDSKSGARGIAAVNGDFFYGYRIDGQMVYLPRNASIAHGRPVRLSKERTRVIGVDRAGNNFIGEVGLTGTVTRGKSTISLSGVNWESIPDNGAVLYTRKWSANAVRPRGSVEWIVKRNKITNVRTGARTGHAIPTGAKVVAFGSGLADKAKRAKHGAAVTLSLQQDLPGTSPLQEAIGRGMQLVDHGALKLPCKASSSWERPRTTVGWTSTGQWMTLSLPGSGYDRNGYRIGGLGLSQEAKVAVALGFDEAAELDGGGSTTAFVRRADNGWDRVDDKDGIYQRPIPNALVFVPGKK